MITASHGRVKMEAFAMLSQVDTHVAARMIILGITAIVSILLRSCTLKNIHFHNFLLRTAIVNIIALMYFFMIS